MEPLRGVKLASLAREHEDRLKNSVRMKVLTWAFRFCSRLPGVTMILSGMSNYEQMEANIATFEAESPLNENEMETLLDVTDNMLKVSSLYCLSLLCKSLSSETGYSGITGVYNEHCFTDGGFIAPMALMSYTDEKKPSACIGCKSCEAVCPQRIKSPEAMADFAQKLGMWFLF